MGRGLFFGLGDFPGSKLARKSWEAAGCYEGGTGHRWWTYRNNQTAREVGGSHGLYGAPLAVLVVPGSTTFDDRSDATVEIIDIPGLDTLFPESTTHRTHEAE